MNSPFHRDKLDRRHFLARAGGVFVAMLGLLRAPIAFARPLTEALKQIKGRILLRDDGEYRSWWSNMSWYVYQPKRYPHMIVQAQDTDDVRLAIRHARQQGLKVSIRSSGHNMGKAALRKGGMLLDLSRLRAMTIDPESKTAWVGPGVRSVELVQALLQHQLTFPAAHTGMVGLGGYLLGGGMGWNIPELGMACRSVLGVELITANGKLIQADSDNYPELLWAAKGTGPGFFGAVTRYQLQLYPAHPVIRAHKYTIPIEKMEQAIHAFKQIEQQQDKRMEVLLKIGRFHPIEKTYADRELVCTASFVAFADSEQDVQRILQPVLDSSLSAISVASKEDIALDYMKLYRPVETDISSPYRTTGESVWTDDPGQCLLNLADMLQKQPPPSPRTFALCVWGFNDTLVDPRACLYTGGRHYLSWFTIGEKETDIEANYQWMDGAVASLRPFSKGHYINEIDPVRYPQHVQECFTRDSWEKLGRLRTKYDPQGVFHTYLGQDA